MNKFIVSKLILTVLLTCSLLKVFASTNEVNQVHNNIDDKSPAIKVVMAAAFVSDSGIDIYDRIFDYLGEKLGRKVDFVSGFSYETINSMLDSGMVDVGFICGLPYVLKQDTAEPKIELLLAPVMKNAKYQNKPIYYSYIIVNKDSAYENFTDLKGSRFVFNDEISNSGYNMPRAYLIEQEQTSGFFGHVTRSGSHEESIRMIASGEADVSAVDSLIYDFDWHSNSKFVQQTRIIKTLGPAGIPPIVISTKTPEIIRNQIKDILLNMNNDPLGKQILEEALVDRFAVVDDNNYNGIREMQKLSEDNNYQTIK